MIRLFFILCFIMGLCQEGNCHTMLFHPFSYGLKDATNGIERYRVLLRCHQEAVEKGGNVSYKGIKAIPIEIPDDFVPIPLTTNTDFAGIRIRVTNNKKNCYLFSLVSQLNNTQIKGTDIDRGDFTYNSLLSSGTAILVVEDENWWSYRKGYSYQAMRKDIMLVREGRASNGPITSYSTKNSKPKGAYRKVGDVRIIIKNLNFVRTSESTYKTYCLKLENQCNVSLENISIATPDNSDLYGDAAILLRNCFNVTLNDVRIYGTYSQTNKFGYGISLNNIYGLTINRMYARSKWGVFGTNNLQNVTLTDCNINRFDIHCYGRDVKAVNCKFSGLYNQFSSVYGKIEFEGCTFTNFRPVLIESSYNAYTPFELSWKNCKFNLNKKHNYLMTLFGVPEAYNERPELRRKCLPNISVVNCKVVLADDVDKWYLIHTGGVKYKDSFDYITNITMRNVRIKGNKRARFELSTERLNTTNTLNTSLDIRR